MLIRGACHCRNVAFALTWDPDPTQIVARACTCSFCAKHAGLWSSSPDAALEVRVLDPTLVSRYAFGTETADFHICCRCGVVVVVTSRIDDRRYAVVNVNAFEGVDPQLIRRLPASFDDEGQDARRLRRQRHWIPNVAWVERGP